MNLFILIVTILSHCARADSTDPFSHKLIPLPIYATEPNEGSTWGFMPVILTVENATGRTDSIYAPSVSWNSVIGTTGTMRWYHYPSATQTFLLNVSASQHVNGGVYLDWSNLPKGADVWTDEAVLRAQRSIFYRFFGFGPDTPEGAESSNTRAHAELDLRRGYSFTPTLNLGLVAKLRRDVVQTPTVPDYPSTFDAFPGAPGLGGATLMSELLDLRWDTRKAGQYSAQGSYVEVLAGPEQGISDSPNDFRFAAEGRQLVPELDWLQGSARVYAEWVTASNLPFYYQPSLGGSYLLRGFIQDRFVAPGAWEAEIEQRIHLFTTHIYGVAANWRVDPFVAVGQVFENSGDLFSNPRWTTGLGFRAFVEPNVVGRVDVATGGEGPEVYVELGYPY